MNPELKYEPPEPNWPAKLKSQIESLRFGTMQVVVHDSRVVQIERTEKVRFDKAGQAEFTRIARKLS